MVSSISQALHLGFNTRYKQQLKKPCFFPWSNSLPPYPLSLSVKTCLSSSLIASLHPSCVFPLIDLAPFCTPFICNKTPRPSQDASGFFAVTASSSHKTSRPSQDSVFVAVTAS